MPWVQVSLHPNQKKNTAFAEFFFWQGQKDNTTALLRFPKFASAWSAGKF